MTTIALVLAIGFSVGTIVLSCMGMHYSRKAIANYRAIERLHFSRMPRDMQQQHVDKYYDGDTPVWLR